MSHDQAGSSHSAVRFILPLLVASLMSVGCQTTGGPTPEAPPAAGAPIDEVHLLTSPSALNFDNDPGVDGFSASIYLIKRDRAKAQWMTEGKLEVLLFEGVVRNVTAADARPRQVWTYGINELRNRAYGSLAGVGYRFDLRWETQPPITSDITVVARHVTEGGQTIYSAPISIAVKAK